MREELVRALEKVYTPEEASVMANSVKLANNVAMSYGVSLDEFASEVAATYDVGLEKNASFSEEDVVEVEKIASVGFDENMAQAIVFATKQAKTIENIYKSAGVCTSISEMAKIAAEDATEKNIEKIALAKQGWSKDEVMAMFRGER